MQAFTKHTGLVVPMDRSDVDTDQLMPKQFLKRIERSGFGQFLFYDWRYTDENMTPNPDFELNKPEYNSDNNTATVLLARKNFGCGSSREHAPWGLADYGFRVIIASSFADIFYNNSFKNGMLLIKLPEEKIEELFQREAANRPWNVTVDLENNVITDAAGLAIPFEIEPAKRHRLLNGLDDIGITLQNEERIAEYEKTHGIA